MENNTVGQRIERSLREKGMKQADLAKILNVDVRMVSRWVRCGVVPRAQTINEIAQVLGVTAEYLLGVKEKSVPIVNSISDFTTEELLAELKRRIEAL